MRMDSSNYTFEQYQRDAMTTCLPESMNTAYMLLEIVEEVGEVAGKVSKAIRHGNLKFNNNDLSENFSSPTEAFEWYSSIAKEIGDVLWGIAGLCHVMGFSLEETARMNIRKLHDRKERGKIDGAGDNR